MEHLSQFIVNHWILWASFIVVMILILINEWVSNKKKAKELSPQEVIALINNDQAIIIDIRDKESFKKGHIINALNAHIDDFSKPKLTQHKDKTIVIVCNRGIEASGVAEKIKGQGFTPFVMNGGITAWQEADLPLVKG